MLTFISCAKTMASHCRLSVPDVTIPVFGQEALETALELAQYSASELGAMLHVGDKIAAENRLRFHDFCSPSTPSMPALCAYTGAVFKRIAPSDFSAEDFHFAQQHLLITSFLYGLLRPLDLIKPYRLEGGVCLPGKGGISMFDYWKPRLTDFFIETVRNSGGILLNLASGEMKDLFCWKQVEHEVRVVTPEFQVWKVGKLKTVTVYAKMCRGEMVRYLIKNRVDTPDAMRDFTWEGFRLDESRSTADHWLFTLA
ncbi:hypothetical protein B5F34_06025 [Mediterranea sp. An20]|uniref:YaaA family protein n=1 Tax=Mediterranea sp. An20 TaxID=1965586 RepID=UPI000B397915|nr:YaaA family protein [Mediterranea sp. An20]OUP10024.1 hypothetical protein B5F34_06025 [Mediterranea sp. An20]